MKFIKNLSQELCLPGVGWLGVSNGVGPNVSRAVNHLNSAWAKGFSCEVTHVGVSRKPQLFTMWLSHDLAASPEQVIPDR